MYRFNNQVALFQPTRAKAEGVTFNKAQSVLCSLENTTLTGLFITAKLFVAIFFKMPGYSVSRTCLSCYFVMMAQHFRRVCAEFGLCVAYWRGSQYDWNKKADVETESSGSLKVFKQCIGAFAFRGLVVENICFGLCQHKTMHLWVRCKRGQIKQGSPTLVLVLLFFRRTRLGVLFLCCCFF